jgi:hypothetical protein
MSKEECNEGAGLVRGGTSPSQRLQLMMAMRAWTIDQRAAPATHPSSNHHAGCNHDEWGPKGWCGCAHTTGLKILEGRAGASFRSLPQQQQASHSARADVWMVDKEAQPPRFLPP